MQYCSLGNSGLMVSRICLGTLMFGDRTEEGEADRIVGLAREYGVNFIDTADRYNIGASEEMVGRLIKSDRYNWVLSTKVGNPMSERLNESGLGRKWIFKAVDDSLRRLQTDYVDIYYLHLDDVDTPLEETLRAVSDITAAGKARYFGISNYRGWRISEIAHICVYLGIAKPVACQPYYNAVNRVPEVEILPVCHHHGIGVVPYSPLARGVLTGKYKLGCPPHADTRAGRRDKRMMETEFREESFQVAQRIVAHSEARGITAGQWAINWVLANPIVNACIAGPRTVEQWVENIEALAYSWDPSDEAFLDSLVPIGHPSTPGYSDPKYPIMGRPMTIGR